MDLHPDVIEVFKKGQAQFNASVIEARRLSPTFDEQAFFRFLQAEFSDVAGQIAAQKPNELSAIITELFDFALTMAAQDLLHNNVYELPVSTLWQQLIPAYMRLLLQHSGTLPGVLVNAMLYLKKYRSVDLSLWMQSMQRIAPYLSTLEEFRFAGQLLAWRAGVVHFREGVLAIVPRFIEITRHALSFEQSLSVEDWCKNSIANPWWDVNTQKADFPQLQKRAGAFGGLGGEFISTPSVRASEDGFWVKSGERYFLLMADKFGAVFHAASAAEYEQATLHIDGFEKPQLQDNRLSIGTKEIGLDETFKGGSVSSNAHSLAIVTPYSYSIQLWSR